jgi:membrane peptidoglycan carboxypeptidase
LRRTVSAETAAQLTSMMETVVARGTGTRAAIPGYSVAGKTGTASKVVGGRYSRSDYNVSFVGFVPSQDPLFTIVVVVDSPRKGSAYGGVVAAPIFQRIADRALRHSGVPPSIDAAPPFLVARQRDVDTREQPASRPASLPLLTPVARSYGSPSMVPDLHGLGARDALRSLAQLGLTGSLHGAGVVVAQRPEPGTPVERGASATLWLERQMVPRLVSDTRP